MNNKNIEIRKAKQDCFCKACDKQIKRNGENIIYFYSHRNKGIHVHICLDCCNDIYKLRVEERS